MVETDFDIAKGIVEKLKGKDISEQERILRWVKESLGLKKVPASPATTPNKVAPSTIKKPALPSIKK
jgi:hypothetical protein